jgi:hypothetical protein
MPGVTGVSVKVVRGRACGVTPNAAGAAAMTADRLGAYVFKEPNISMRQWSNMDEAIRYRVEELAAGGIPTAAGVYAWYRNGKRQYVGMAASLRDRLWKNHLGRSRALSSSALRRNVAHRLGFGPTAALKRREIALTSEQLDRVHAWLRSCKLAWLTCRSVTAAITLERHLRAECLPPLNQR